MVETVEAGKNVRGRSVGNGRARGSSAPAKPSTRKLIPLVGGAFAGGLVLAKIVDWRGHAHPRG